STDKVDTEIPSPVSGTLLEIKADEDETVEVGGELAIIGDKDAGGGGGEPEEKAEPEQKPEQKPEPEKKAEPEQKAEPQEKPEPEKKPEKPAAEEAEPPAAEKAPAPRPESPQVSSEKSSYVTPIVRKLAGQHGVSLDEVEGSGVGGRIRKQDVLDAAKKQEAAAAPAESEPPPGAEPGAPAEVSPLRGKTEKLSRLRKMIASRMVESLQVSAQLTTVVEIDVTRIARLREAHKSSFLEREGVKLSFLPFFAKATVDALKQYPQVNSTVDLDEGTVTYHGAENLGMAVDTDAGLIVPVIKDAGDLSIAGLARKIADLADRTRNKKIAPDDLSGGTFTLTNTGSRGALFDTPIINQPQVGILGTGAVVKRPVVIDDTNLGETIAVRNMVYFALTYDHRIVDGADAARFLNAVKERLEEGSFESDLG
ncbi:MAG: 2-oxoglutarate dehydrogenase, E2 component, dihydrolipoamide succinyltransferase, partial [Nocardioidaceae bacterium]